MPTPPPQSPFGRPSGEGWRHLPPATPPARKPWRSRTWFTHGAVALVALGLGAGLAGGGKAGDAQAASPEPTATRPTVSADAGSRTAAPAPAVTTAEPTTQTREPKPTTTPPPKPVAAPEVSGDGEYLVGQDMKPGTYKTSGPADGLCYWERDKDSSGEFDSIIANGTPTGTGRVTVKKGEVFKTQGCEDWTKVG
ncbi:hypothetical protein [Streptomyces sp. HPF1205]|uniref:hypothetical protein n=1 Tax=Streptomyces sp. HPF1205 TaxID=2873262 RepID=UPI001CECB46A|nr:hypothetical protein [Streptomyces sp. HPF1205]